MHFITVLTGKNRSEPMGILDQISSPKLEPKNYLQINQAGIPSFLNIYHLFTKNSRGDSSVLFAYLFLLLFGQIENIYKVMQDSLHFVFSKGTQKQLFKEESAPIFHGGSPKISLQSDIFCCSLEYLLIRWRWPTFYMLCMTCPCLRRKDQLSADW